MYKISKFIVEKRVLFFVLFAAMVVYSIFSIPKVGIEYSITAYLPKNTDTAKALEIMDDEFVDYGMTKIMVSNITYERAEALYKEIKQYEGVKSFYFENSSDYYRNSSALFNITFTGDSKDARSRAAYEKIKTRLGGYDYSIPTPLFEDFASTLASEMVIILIIAAFVILLVLLLTSKSFAEILAFPAVFVIAAILNMGTNHWLGKISFISNTVCVVLQLALAIDYSIILCHRFTEEKELLPGNASEAMIKALSKSIPEISASSLTTVSGMVALMFMQLRLGYDLGMVLAKSIVFSLLTVFLLMPGILMTVTSLMDKTRHRNLIPSIDFFGKGIVKIRYLLMPLFFAVFCFAAYYGGTLEYVYSESAIDTPRPTATMSATKKCEEVFGYDNMFVILLPKGDYERERQVLDAVKTEPMISTAVGIANIEVSDGYYLSDSVTYRDIAEILDISDSSALGVMRLYAIAQGDYWAINDNKIEDYNVTIIELLDWLFEHDDYLNLNSEQKENFDNLKERLLDAEAQLIGESYSRLVFNIDGATESKETFALIARITPVVKQIYPTAIFAGSSMSAYDLNESFVSDNLLISILTAAFIFVILMFTFGSWGIPLPLVFVIQGAIFMNFAYPALLGNNLFFFVYLIGSAIQMGATIDYAIVITSRYRALRRDGFDKKQAVATTISQSFPTVFTSGTIMTVSSFLIGFISTEPLIASIGICLGRGTIISIICVMTVLPALLFTLDKPLSKTLFKKRERKKPVRESKLARLLASVGALKAALLMHAPQGTGQNGGAQPIGSCPQTTGALPTKENEVRAEDEAKTKETENDDEK